MAKVIEPENTALQSNRVLARVGEEEIQDLPVGLHVPNDAMYVLLDSFEGPLDLLLHLVRKNNLNILDFQIAEITAQFISYVELMTSLRLKQAGNYLVMAATLVEIKSRALLPKSTLDEEDSVDEELELRLRLLAYENLKNSAQAVGELPRMERDIHSTNVHVTSSDSPKQLPQLSIDDLITAFAEIVTRARLYNRHRISRVKISVPQRIADIEQKIRNSREDVPFSQLFKVEEGLASVVASFMAILDLLKRGVAIVRQDQAFGMIYVSKKD